MSVPAGLTPLRAIVYGKEGSKVYAIQQRSPLMKVCVSLRPAPSDVAPLNPQLMRQVTQSRVYIIAAVFHREFADIVGHHIVWHGPLEPARCAHAVSQAHHLESQSRQRVDGFFGRATTYHVIPNTGPATPLPPVLEELKTHIPPLSANAAAGSIPEIPGSGITRQLLSGLPASFPPTGLILEYVLEGDNRADARILAGASARCLQEELQMAGQGTLRECTYHTLVAEKADWLCVSGLK